MPASFSLRGTVVERVPAGSYLYLRVEQPTGTTHWVATLARTAASGPEVDVTVFARSDHFHSRRLERDFDPLLFGAVSPRQELP